MKSSEDTIEGFSVPKTIELVDKLQKSIDDLSIHTRRSDMYPFDTVAGQMLSKAFALARAAIVLIENGYPDEAFGLCRSLYELSIYLRYITQDQQKRNDRSRKFLEFGVTSKAFWFDLLDKFATLTESERKDIERYKAENRIPDDPKRMTQPWSEVRQFVENVSKEAHPLDVAASTEALRQLEKAIAYTDASTYVHCTQPGLNSYTFEWKEPVRVKKSRRGAASAVKTCMLVQTHLLAVVRYCLFGMGVVPLAELKKSQQPEKTRRAHN